MLENFSTRFKKKGRRDQNDKSKNAAKERLHLVLMQDRAHVSADFLDMMKQEIVDVIKKYIDVDEEEMDVKLENKVNEDGTSGAPALYANIPIVSINEEKKKESQEIAKTKLEEQKAEEKSEESKQEKDNSNKKTHGNKMEKVIKKLSKGSEKKNDGSQKTSTAGTKAKTAKSAVKKVVSKAKGKQANATKTPKGK